MVENIAATDEQVKLVIVMRNDLNMRKARWLLRGHMRLPRF